MTKMSMVHMNSNIMCAIDISTNHPDPLIGEIFQISIVPLDAVLIPQGIPFDTLIRTDTEFFDSKDNKRMFEHSKKTGLPQESVWELFDSWFNQLGLRENKNIIPLCWDWAFVKPHLMKFFGEYNFDTFFNKQVRDVLPLVHFNNDRADFHALDIPYPKYEALTNLAQRCTIYIDGEPRDPLYRCKVLGQVYHELCMDRSVTIL